MIFFFIFIIAINLLLIFFFNFLSNFYNQFDYPDFKRKIHTRPVSLLGGTFVTINIFLVIIFDNFFSSINYEFFNNFLNLYFFLFLILVFFLLGFIDDKFNIGANKKLFITFSLLSILFYVDNSLLIKNLNFSFFYEEIGLGGFSYFFTILCFLLFINAFNMLDGINGQAATYSLFLFFILLSKSILPLLIIVLIISLLSFLFLNLNSKTYLGDSGSITLGFLLSYLFVKSYSLNKFYADEIFLIMSIPGYDLLRLAITRIFKKKHPFMPDNFHMHHLLIKKINFFKTYVLLQTLMLSPYLLYKLLNSFYLAFFLSLFAYSLLIIIFNKKL
jgi:UDP-N-acetylmuramyl pentapeptide phosphotransferase/UDP-N-acetylglucosamine-1-phosphate transferase